MQAKEKKSSQGIKKKEREREREKTAKIQKRKAERDIERSTNPHKNGKMS